MNKKQWLKIANKLNIKDGEVIWHYKQLQHKEKYYKIYFKVKTCDKLKMAICDSKQTLVNFQKKVKQKYNADHIKIVMMKQITKTEADFHFKFKKDIRSKCSYIC